MTGIEASWSALGWEWQECVRQAVASFAARGLPVGAVITSPSGMIAAGRNRVYDQRGGTEVLQRTPLAHAEMNALAAVSPDEELGRCALWSTHSPCSMCRAAAEFLEIGAVRHLAADPSEPGSPHAADVDPVWAVAVNVLFLHNVAWVGSPDSPMVQRNREQDPETTALALHLVDRRTLIDQVRSRRPTTDPVALLTPVWAEVVAAAAGR